ncbi:hypothetical protein IMG5_175800 [Ichthyophthirius multifiliis]|uniref:Dynein regulatory complex subunit 2 n=1 Tax=Ichthyophthirius multifiliis TaxID=5932 RepID=G0R278_ICHMU|nr:hypothetical protein IMG5_175800 [Ichthyophthirius multifiliis]EGR28425.1 hypothetical protein IMG5_175800 [Ichthyophthirius multifiliis]|eukprot:XP_004029661.1 hypothetical protein IMG5_175800 [Ichthyophthirius multifiliis]
MGLLGKTLKGRTVRPGGFPPIRNIKWRKLTQSQEEYEQNLQLQKLQHEKLRNQILEEQKLIFLNKRKLHIYWRKTLRVLKTEDSRKQMSLLIQYQERELDKKQGFIRMLDNNLDLADEQFYISLKNHLLHLENLNNIQEQRINGINNEFMKDLKILEQEFRVEKDSMDKTHETNVRELEEFIEVIKEEQKLSKADQENDYAQMKEQTRNLIMEEINNIKLFLESKQIIYYTQLEQLNSRFQNDTQNKVKEHQFYYQDSKQKQKQIDRYLRLIKYKKIEIELLKLKINQLVKECSDRNQNLKYEINNVHKLYKQLKNQMFQFREDMINRLKELITNQRDVIIQLKQYVSQGERMLILAELSRKFETEREKVIPYYESSTINEKPEDVQYYKFLSQEDLKEQEYLDNFFKRFNKVLLDKLAIQQQKEILEKQNYTLKDLLKQQLDGISINDNIINNLNNPLFIVNNKYQIEQNILKKTESIKVKQNNRV